MQLENRDDVLLRHRVSEYRLCNSEVLSLIIDDKVGFLQQSASNHVSCFVHSTADREISRGIQIDPIAGFEIESSVM